MNPYPVRSAPGISRRTFLRTATAAAAAPLVLPSGLRAASPNGKLAHACIGVTRMGGTDLKNFQQHDGLRIVALCDVDSKHLATAAKLVPGARLYADWRELLAKEGDRVDSVNVTTPDHMHFPIAMEVLRRRKHLHLQKPMCHDLDEVRTLVETAARTDVVTQLGTQHASETGDRMVVEMLRNRVVGRVEHVILCSTRPAPNRIRGPRPPQGAPPPQELDWDKWIGTAPMRPYAPGVYHPAAWRGWQDFGTSWIADMGTHLFDATWRAFDLKAPASVVAEVEESWKASPGRRAENWPQAEHVAWTFPGGPLTDGRPLTVEWFDGEMLPPADVRALVPIDPYPKEAALWIGTEGVMLQIIGSGPLLYPAEKFKDVPRPKPEPRNHTHHYVDACLGRATTESHLAQTGPTAEAILLATIAVRCFGHPLTWDPAGMKIGGCAEAQAMVRRAYRTGW